MKYYLSLALLLFVSLLSSCDKENFATLEVVNQTNCLYNLYNGGNANGAFLGPVGANQVEEFSISLGTANNGFETFYAEPQCPTIGFGEQFGLIEFQDGETVTILID